MRGQQFMDIAKTIEPLRRVEWDGIRTAVAGARRLTRSV